MLHVRHAVWDNFFMPACEICSSDDDDATPNRKSFFLCLHMKTVVSISELNEFSSDVFIAAAVVAP